MLERQRARISFATLELLWKVLMAKRWEILKAMAGQEALTIREDMVPRSFPSNSRFHPAIKCTTGRNACETFGAFGEDLIRMLRRPTHHIEYQLQIIVRYVYVEQVRHAVYKNHAWTTPPQRNVERVRPERQREAIGNVLGNLWVMRSA